jgi:hypothetical protein
MMTNVDVIYKGGKFILSAAASAGAKVLVDEAVKKLTPENLSAAKKFSVEVAKWGGAAAAGTVCAQAVGDKLEKSKEYVTKIVKFINVVETENAKKSEPVVKDVEENNIVEIDEPELVEDGELSE